MNYKSHKVHKSLITLHFTADEVSFVEHRSPARIVEALVEDFVALAGSGFLTVVVQNIGALTADFAVCFRAANSILSHKRDVSETTGAHSLS